MSKITRKHETKNQCLETAALDAVFQEHKTFIASNNTITEDGFIKSEDNQTSLKSYIHHDLLNTTWTKL